MAASLTDAVEALIVSALPGLAGTVSVSAGRLDLDPASADAAASEPRPDDQVDEVPFGGPYRLSKPPYPGPRRVSLVTGNGDRIVVGDGEVSWDKTDPQVFTLQPRPGRDLAGVTAVAVLYGVTSVFATLKAVRALTVTLTSGDLERAEALTIAVLTLARDRIADTTWNDDDYGATVSVDRLRFTGATTAGELTLLADLELKVTRVLGDGEGGLIEQVGLRASVGA